MMQQLMLEQILQDFVSASMPTLIWQISDTNMHDLYIIKWKKKKKEEDEEQQQQHKTRDS